MILFADDTNIFVSGPNINELCLSMNTELSKLSKSVHAYRKYSLSKLPRVFETQCGIGDWRVCLDVCLKSLLLQFLYDSDETWHTWCMRQLPIWKNFSDFWKISEILIFKFSAIFLNFTLGLSLATAAAK